MNDPTGFHIVGGQVVNVKPWAALFNSALWPEATHMILGAFIVAGCLVATPHAWALLRGRGTRYHRVGLALALTVAMIAAPAQIVVGDWAARHVALKQPSKLAAIEGVTHTTKGAALHIGGVYIDGEVKGAIRIPDLLSLLAYDNPHATVQGLDAIAAADRPPVNVVRTSFQLMVAIGFAFLGLALWLAIAWRRKRALPRIALVPAGRGVVGSGRGARTRMWLGRHRGRPATLDRVPRDAHSRRGERRARAAVRVLLVARRLHRARDRGVHRLAATRAGAVAGGGNRMSLANAVAAAMFGGITLYALLAGADFGAGFWDLFAGNAERGAPTRALIEESIGPVWEANHVWLIFVLVTMWTGFPTAFAPIMSTLYIPLTLAAVGIILRGASFAFRKASRTLSTRRIYGAAFASSSVITPFFLGAVVGGVASGRVPAGTSTGDVFSSWLNPTSMLGGVMAVIVCAFLAAVYLAADADRRNQPALAAMFRTRALGAGVAAGVVAAVGVEVLHADAPTLFHGLTHRGAPLIAVSAVAGVTTLVLVARGRFAIGRYVGALAVVAVLWGWAAGQYPWMLVHELTIEEAAAPHATLVAGLVAFGFGSLLLVPALVWLLVLVQRGDLAAEP